MGLQLPGRRRGGRLLRAIHHSLARVLDLANLLPQSVRGRDLSFERRRRRPGVTRRVEIQGCLERRAERRSSRDCLSSSPPRA